VRVRIETLMRARPVWKEASKVKGMGVYRKQALVRVSFLY
jgi:hypothetical protein